MYTTKAFGFRTYVITCFLVAMIMCSLAKTVLGQYQIGDTRLLRSSELLDNTLRERPSGRAGLTSYRYLIRVGGLAFEEIATLPPELRQHPLELTYDVSREDGARAVLDIATNTYPLPLYDWELLPIAEYADSEFTAVISLLGGETNFEYFHIRYHPAFEDTLLGLRLFQADILPLNPEQYWQLPRSTGTVIIGKGERAPDRDSAISAAHSIQKLVHGFAPDSWVLTDLGESASVLVENDFVTVGIDPYYSFWVATDEFPPEGEDFAVKQINDLIAAARSAGWEKLNPAVWSAVSKTARFAALFRMVKEQHPKVWAAFMRRIYAQDKPYLETPNQMPRF
jgi:hypothetical protein